MHFVRVLLGSKGLTRAALPSGTLRLQKLRRWPSGRRGSGSEPYALWGTSLGNPTLLLVRGTTLVASVSPYVVLTREEHAGRFAELSGVARELNAELLRDLAKRLPHRVDSPVWITGARLFDPTTGTATTGQNVVVFRDRIVGLREARLRQGDGDRREGWNAPTRPHRFPCPHGRLGQAPGHRFRSDSRSRRGERPHLAPGPDAPASTRASTSARIFASGFLEEIGLQRLTAASQCRPPRRRWTGCGSTRTTVSGGIRDLQLDAACLREADGCEAHRWGSRLGARPGVHDRRAGHPRRVRRDQPHQPAPAGVRAPAGERDPRTRSASR